MSETLPSADPGAQKRRSTRIAQAVPISVAGVDALGQPFKERTTTVMVNCHGCKYQSKHYVPKNSVVTLEIPRIEPAFPPRIVQGHVVWVQRPRTVRELFQIGLEFETAAGNVWGISFPPEDWFPPEDEKAAAEAAAPSEELDMDVEVEKTESAPAPQSVSGPAGVNASPPSFEMPASPAGGAPTAASVPETKIHVMPSPQIAPQEAQAAIAKQMAQIVAEAKESLDKTLRRGALTAINDEMVAVRQQLDSQMHETVDRAIKAAMERISESEVKKLVQQVANKAAAIVEEARLASEAQVVQIDSRVREAIKHATNEAAETAVNRATSQMAAASEEMRKVAEANLQSVEERTRKAAQDAVTQATAITDEARRAAETNLQAAEENIRKTAEDAARLAANRAIQQTVDQDLRNSVEGIMQRIVAEREAKMPSLRVLSSPEAAQAHLEDWKTRLAQSAEEVHSRTVEQSRAQVEEANRKWREEIESLTSQSSAHVSQQLNEASQAALANAENQWNERGSALRKSFDDVTARMKESIDAFRARLEEQRAEAERSKALLREASESALEQTRQKFGQLAAEHQAETERARNSIREASESAVQQTQQNLSQTAAEHRAESERAKNSIREASESVVQQTHQKISQVAAEQHDAIGRLMENLIVQRIQSIDPILTSAAQTVMERFSGEIEHKIGSKVEEARRTVVEISDAGARAGELRSQLTRQLEDAKAQAAHIQDSIPGRVQQGSDAAVQKALADLTSVHQEVARLQTELRQSGQQLADEAANQRESALEQIRHASNDSVQSSLAKLAEAAQNADKLKESIRGQIESASGQITLIEHGAREKVQRESESAVQKAVSDLAFAGQEVVRLQDTLRAHKQQAAEAADEAARTAHDKIHDMTNAMVQEALSALENSAAQAARLQDGIRQQREQAEAHFSELVTQSREQVKAASEQETREAIERARQQAANLPAELETSCRATIARMEEELDQKSSEMQHSAYEALLKTSEWYQKKAQTSMQSTMERVVDQSSNALTEKAREVSGMFASELDHYHVQFLDHGKATIEEAAREAVDRSRSKLTEATEIASATITDRVQHIMRDALSRFQTSSEETTQKSLLQIKNTHESSLDDFQKKVDDKMTLGVEQAATYLQSQLVPLMESWEDKRQVEEQEWNAQLKQSSEESIAAYRARLENTTNGWLLASAATLGQNSQAVLDSLSKAAEKQLRDTCSRVLAGMADILRDRLMGISAAVAPEKDPPKE